MDGSSVEIAWMCGEIVLIEWDKYFLLSDTILFHLSNYSFSFLSLSLY